MEIHLKIKILPIIIILIKIKKIAKNPTIIKKVQVLVHRIINKRIIQIIQKIKIIIKVKIINKTKIIKLIEKGL
jgi:hypothetical protein